MQSQKYDRFKDAPWYSEEKAPILIGGAGGIGSWLTVFATRAGFECHVFDFDTLEAVNMAGQLFFHSDIGKSKVEALANVVRATCDEELFIYNEAVTENTMTNNLVFTAFDNIKARADMFNSWMNDFKGDPSAVFIDGRLMAEQLTIFIIRGDDEEAIEDYLTKHLPSDDTIADAPCTFKQVSHNAGMIAAQMVAFLTNFITGVRSDDKSRATPYKTEHMTALDYRKQHYRPAKTPAPRDLSFEEQGDSTPSKVELAETVEDEEVLGMEDEYEEGEELTEESQAPIIYGTAGEMGPTESMDFTIFDPTPVPQSEGSIPTPPRFVNPSVALRELVRAKNLKTFPSWIGVSIYNSSQMLEMFREMLIFSEREWLRQNPNAVFTTGEQLPYHGVPELMQYIPYITNNENGYEMPQFEFERMIRTIENRIPENREEAVRIARERNITLTDELPF